MNLNTMCLKKRPPFNILNNSAKNETILIVFGIQNLEEISHRKTINSLTSPEYLVKNNSDAGSG